MYKFTFDRFKLQLQFSCNQHLKRAQFRVETCCANKAWKNLIALVTYWWVCPSLAVAASSNGIVSACHRGDWRDDS
jgi:hypothetical protein